MSKKKEKKKSEKKQGKKKPVKPVSVKKSTGKKAGSKPASKKAKPTKKSVAAKSPSKNTAPSVDKKQASAKSTKKQPSRPPIPRTPADNVRRPFNIIESYMGEYRFNDMFAVLFVCTGNMCRSPLAEGIFKRKLAIECPESIKHKIWVESCGIYAYDGNKPSENAIKVGHQNGVDISAIRSKPINRVLVEQSDLIFALSIDHLNYIQENFPTARHKTYLMKVFGKDRGVTISDSIPDPMGFSMDFYLKTYNEIHVTIDEIFQKVVAMAEQKLNPKSSESM
ncbi:MAG TPA: hypothetical protein PLC94_06960 [bacterium]|nr:hypothetical protein [bacterium]